MMDWDNRTQTGARAPGVERNSPLERRCSSAQRTSAQYEDHDDASGEHEGWTQTERRNNLRRSGRPRLTYRPWSRTGENPPYGILGRAMETSASFEARYAPLLYPTNQVRRTARRSRSGNGCGCQSDPLLFFRRIDTIPYHPYNF